MVGLLGVYLVGLMDAWAGGWLGRLMLGLVDGLANGCWG